LSHRGALISECFKQICREFRTLQFLQQ
jgi:hypothetical protein